MIVITIAAFKFLTLTATRSSEVRNATWDEIDLATATWTIPAEHTKTGQQHRVPLSTGALKVLFTARQKHWFDFPIPHRTDNEQTLQGKQRRLCPTWDPKLVPGLVRRNRR